MRPSRAEILGLTPQPKQPTHKPGNPEMTSHRKGEVTHKCNLLTPGRKTKIETTSIERTSIETQENTTLKYKMSKINPGDPRKKPKG